MLVEIGRRNIKSSVGAARYLLCRSYGAFVVCVGVATNIPLRSELDLDKYVVTIRMILPRLASLR